MHEQEFRGRPLHVKVSTPQGAKRSATTIVTQVGKSQSPEANGTRDDGAERERTARTLGLMNVPDTVNDARIRALVEPYGQLIKIILRPDHQGAIVEFADTQHAGKASLELEGREIAPGRRLHVGTVPEMLKQSAERKRPGPAKPTEKFLSSSGPIKRPPQPGARSGKRGGLGVKRNPTTTATSSSTPSATTTTSGDGETSKKSNDDFRAMIQGNRTG